MKIKHSCLNLDIFFKLEITGKDFKAFNTFLNLFEQLNCSQNFSYWTIIPGLNKKNFITVLKSPHVNKTAQEQFEYRIYNKYVIVRTFKPAFFLLLIKVIQGLSFPSITLKVTLLTKGLNFINKNINLLELFDPLYVKLQNIPTKKLNQKNIYLSCVNYIEMFDVYGELFIKKHI
jgi:ribosomal protein S10